MSKSPTQNWGHDALAADLAGYLNSTEVMIWTDMQLGPSGSPRPDVYLIRKSYSKPLPLAFECKISRSDLRSDTTSGKWQTYLKYAAGVVFAVPDGLCTTADIPDGCGLIVRKAKEWRYARRPTLRKVEVPFDACMKLLIDGVSRAYRPALPQPRKIALWSEHEAVRKRFGKDVEAAVRDLARVRERIATMKQAADDEWARVQKGIENRAEMLKRQYAEDEAKWAAARAELLGWLEIENGSVWAVQRRIGELKAECGADARVQRAEQTLDRARKAVENALLHLPAPAPVAPAPSTWGEPA